MYTKDDLEQAGKRSRFEEGAVEMLRHLESRAVLARSGDSTYLKGIKVVWGIPHRTETKVVITSVIEGEHVVGFHSDLDPARALVNWYWRVESESVKWRRDEFHYERETG